MNATNLIHHSSKRKSGDPDHVPTCISMQAVEDAVRLGREELNRQESRAREDLARAEAKWKQVATLHDSRADHLCQNGIIPRIAANPGNCLSKIREAAPNRRQI